MGEGKDFERRSSLGKLFFLATIISGVVAAYLMHRRGESLTTIAKKTVTNPLGALASEVKNVL